MKNLNFPPRSLLQKGFHNLQTFQEFHCPISSYLSEENDEAPKYTRTFQQAENIRGGLKIY